MENLYKQNKELVKCLEMVRSQLFDRNNEETILTKSIDEVLKENLYQNLRDNIDHEELKRRRIFNGTQNKENNKRIAEYKQLNGGY